MIALIGRRLAMMALIMLVTSFLLFIGFESDKFFVAGKALGPYSTDIQRLEWLSRNGYDTPFLWRYLAWIGHMLTGNFGTSIQYNTPVAKFIFPSLANTGILALWVFLLTIAVR